MVPQTGLLLESPQALYLVLKKVQPLPAKALQKQSIDTIRQLDILKTKEKEQQSQLLLFLSILSLSKFKSDFKKTNLKNPFEIPTKQRKGATDEAIRSGKGSETAPFGNANEVDENDEMVAESDEFEDGDEKMR